MDKIPKEQVIRRMQVENPWWIRPHTIAEGIANLRPRAYFELFLALLGTADVRRALLLLGPRRVGKTVLIYHAIGALLASGIEPRRLCYVSVDHPLYNGRSLEDLLADYNEAAGVDYRTEPCFVFFDEIQYLRNWEVHLKVLVDGSFPTRFTASGSAAAALRMRSRESGAGRFTDFLLPPLTFSEYLTLLGVTDAIRLNDDTDSGIASNIADLNERFLHYLNFGGYPEVALSKEIQADPGRFVKSDIVDKVLLRDLPSLYGIEDIQELNQLFTTLAYNTAQEVSLAELSKDSGVAKNTIKRYLQYLEAAFLIKTVHRIDQDAKQFQRANFFKVYLTNPSIRTALFAPIDEHDQAMGAMAETGIFSQWFHAPESLYYARWKGGEVDLVHLNQKQKPQWAVEVKWSDRYFERPEELKSLLAFCHKSKLERVVVTTRTIQAEKEVDGIPVEFIPASVYCYLVGQNRIQSQAARKG
jgi:predicted AAA+ superfamily ATPase